MFKFEAFQYTPQLFGKIGASWSTVPSDAGGWNMYGTLSIADVANEYTLQARAAVVVRSEDCTVDMWTTGSWGVVIDPMSSGR